MAASAETVESPFTAFSFDVLLTLATPVAGVGQPVCQGAFAECDGLQVEMEPKTVVQGGLTDAVTHLMGQARYGQLTLRRGMTTTTDLWAWMAAAAIPGRAVTCDGEIAMLSGAGTVQARFVLTGCLPIRLRGPALHAQNGLIAVEELALAVGRLTQAGAAPGGGPDLAAGISGGAQISGGLGLSGQLGGTFSATLSGRAGFGGGG